MTAGIKAASVSERQEESCCGAYGDALRDVPNDGFANDVCRNPVAEKVLLCVVMLCFWCFFLLLLAAVALATAIYI